MTHTHTKSENGGVSSASTERVQSSGLVVVRPRPPIGDIACARAGRHLETCLLGEHAELILRAWAFVETLHRPWSRGLLCLHTSVPIGRNSPAGSRPWPTGCRRFPLRHCGSGAGAASLSRSGVCYWPGLPCVLEVCAACLVSCSSVHAANLAIGAPINGHSQHECQRVGVSDGGASPRPSLAPRRATHLLVVVPAEAAGTARTFDACQFGAKVSGPVEACVPQCDHVTPQAKKGEELDAILLQRGHKIKAYQELAGRRLGEKLSAIVLTEACVLELRSKWEMHSRGVFYREVRPTVSPTSRGVATHPSERFRWTSGTRIGAEPFVFSKSKMELGCTRLELQSGRTMLLRGGPDARIVSKRI